MPEARQAGKCINSPSAEHGGPVPSQLVRAATLNGHVTGGCRLQSLELALLRLHFHPDSVPLLPHVFKDRYLGLPAQGLPLTVDCCDMLIKQETWPSSFPIPNPQRVRELASYVGITLAQGSLDKLPCLVNTPLVLTRATGG